MQRDEERGIEKGSRRKRQTAGEVERGTGREREREGEGERERG